ncbi:MAG: hypothetical protein ACT4OK_20110 [Gemmobacter sp.]
MAISKKADGKDDDDDGDLFPPVKDIVTKLKQGPMNFGCYLTGDKDSPVVLAAHKRKNAEVLGKKAKKKAETPKGAFGTLTLEEGGQLTFQCDTDDAPAALGKRIRKMLKAEGLAKFKISILLPGGVELGESDEEDDDEDSSEAEATEAPEGEGDDPLEQLRIEVQAEFDALCERIDAADEIASGIGRKIASLRGMFEAEIGRDPKKAAGIVTLLRKTAEAAGIGAEDQVVSGPESRASALADLEKGIDALLAEYA